MQQQQQQQQERLSKSKSKTRERARSTVQVAQTHNTCKSIGMKIHNEILDGWPAARKLQQQQSVTASVSTKRNNIYKHTTCLRNGECPRRNSYVTTPAAQRSTEVVYGRSMSISGAR